MHLVILIFFSLFTRAQILTADFRLLQTISSPSYVLTAMDLVFALVQLGQGSTSHTLT